MLHNVLIFIRWGLFSAYIAIEDLGLLNMIMFCRELHKTKPVLAEKLDTMLPILYGDLHIEILKETMGKLDKTPKWSENFNRN